MNICYLLGSVGMVFFGTSLFLLMAISIDRYWAICHPMSHKVHKDNAKSKYYQFSAGVFCTILMINMSIEYNRTQYALACNYLAMYRGAELIYIYSWPTVVALVILVLYFYIFKAIREHVSTVVRRRAR